MNKGINEPNELRDPFYACNFSLKFREKNELEIAGLFSNNFCPCHF